MTFRRWIKHKRLWLYSKIVRDSGSPESVARGWAIGMFIGCTVPFGAQLVVSVPLAILMKASKAGAVIGTFITNHFTIFFIYPAQVWVGSRLAGGSLGYSQIKDVMGRVVEEQSWDALLSLGGEITAAFFIGGLALALVCTPATYFAVLRSVRLHRARRGRAGRHGNAARDLPST